MVARALLRFLCGKNFPTYPRTKPTAPLEQSCAADSGTLGPSSTLSGTTVGEAGADEKWGRRWQQGPPSAPLGAKVWPQRVLFQRVLNTFPVQRVADQVFLAKITRDHGSRSRSL